MMTKKQAVMGGVLLGSTLGGFVPLLWGSSEISFASVFCSAIGGILGIYIGFKMSQYQ